MSVECQDSGCGFTMEELVTSEISGVSGTWLEDSQDTVTTRPRIKVCTCTNTT